MLQRIRDGLHSHKWLGYLVLGALALVFAAWGAYGIVNVNLNASNYAAEAGGQKISVETARNAWLREQTQYQQRLGGDLPPQMKQMLQDRLLESMIRDALLSERTHDLGYRVSEKDVLDAVRNEPAFQIEGRFDPNVAKSRLEQAGLSQQAYEAELRGSLQRSQLQMGIAVSDFQTPTEIARSRQLQNEERQVRYITIPADKYSASVQVDDAAVNAYYKAHQSEYMTPELVHLQYAELRLDQLAAQITPNEADLKAAYEKHKDRYLDPEKRHARHILIPVGTDDAQARRQAEEVLAQAKSGKDFAALAKQYSKDPGSADKGGDLGWADRNQFVAPFTQALFGMKVGDIAGPIKTQFGYHIIKLDEIQPAREKTFEAARPELEAELRRNAAADKFGEIQERLQSKMEQSAGDLPALATEFGLQTGDIPQFLRGAGAPPLGSAQPIQDLVFGDTPLPTGKLGGPVVVGEDKLVIVKVLEHRKPEPKPLAEVRDSILAAIRKERGAQEALKAAQAGQAKLEAGASFDEVAKELGVSAEPAHFVGRTDPSLPTQLRDLVFNLPKPGDQPVYRAVPMQTGGAALLALTRLRDGSPPAVDKDQEVTQARQRAMQARQDAARHGQEEAAAYVEEMRRTADVRKNLKVFE